VPATQITPDSIDEISTQQQDFLTQEDQRLLFHDENSNVPSINTKESLPKEGKHSCRDYYEQLFSSDSDTEDIRSSVTQKSDLYLQEFSSDMSISVSDLSEDDSSVLQYRFEPIADSHNNKSSPPIPTMNVNHISNLIDLPEEEKNKSNQDDLEDLSKLPTEIKDNLLGFNEPIPKLMTQESSPENHTDKIGCGPP